MGIEKIKNQFWKEVLLVYLEKKRIYVNEEITKGTIGNQLIFNNSLIKYKGKVLHFQTWRQTGFHCIRDLIQNDTLLTLNEVQRKIGKNKAMVLFEYNALSNAIPNQWKEWITEGLESDQKLEYDAEIELFKNKPKVIKEYLKNKPKAEKTQTIAGTFWKRKLI